MRKQEMHVINEEKEDLYGILIVPDQPIKGYVQLLHDLKDQMDRYEETLQYFARHGYLAFGFDMPGHGNSSPEKAQYSHEQFTRDVHTFFCAVVERYPIKKANQQKAILRALIGVGFGAMVAKQYVIAYQDCNALILCGDYGFPDFTKPLMQCLKLLAKDTEKNQDQVVEHCFWKQLGIEDKEQMAAARISDRKNRRKLQQSAMLQKEYAASYILTIMNLYQQTDMKDWLQACPKYLPILVLSGYEDVFSNYTRELDRMLRKLKYSHMKNVFYKYYEHQKHDLLFEAAAPKVLEDIEKLLRKIEQQLIE